jgi:hypothetical protein
MFNNSTPFTMPVAPAYAMNNGGGFGNGFGSDWIGLIVILAILGWGNGGFGGFGGFGGGNRGGYCEPCATKADLTAQGIVQKLDGITYGITDATYALNNSIMGGFHGVDNAICTLGYQNQQGFNTLAHQLSDCCCTTQRAIDGVNYNMATQACETRHAIQDSTRQILDFLTTDKIATLQAENQALKFKASQAEQNTFITANQQAQTAELIRRLGADCPVNAVVVQPNTPVTFPVNTCGQFYGYNNYNNGCGCGLN